MVRPGLRIRLLLAFVIWIGLVLAAKAVGAVL